jgi:hypothetical protein
MTRPHIFEEHFIWLRADGASKFFKNMWPCYLKESEK